MTQAVRGGSAGRRHHAYQCGARVAETTPPACPTRPGRHLQRMVGHATSHDWPFTCTLLTLRHTSCRPQPSFPPARPSPLRLLPASWSCRRCGATCCTARGSSSGARRRRRASGGNTWAQVGAPGSARDTSRQQQGRGQIANTELQGSNRALDEDATAKPIATSCCLPFARLPSPTSWPTSLHPCRHAVHPEAAAHGGRAAARLRAGG